MTLYRLKPLEWKEIDGRHVASAIGRFWDVYQSRGKWRVFLSPQLFLSIEEAKAACEAEFQKTMLANLEPVEEQP